jgi:hypothetical protein
MTLDPVTGWAIAKAAGEVTKTLYEFGKGLKSREEKQQVDEILDKLRELKQAASLLEEENRELRDKLRFKGDDFEWKVYYWVEKKHPDRPLCPKCFSKEMVAHLGYVLNTGGTPFRICTVCKETTDVGPPESVRPHSHFPDGY